MKGGHRVPDCPQVEYGPTAWDGRREAVSSAGDTGTIERELRRWPLSRVGVQCCEYLALHMPDLAVKSLQEETGEPTTEELQAIDADELLTKRWGSMSNPAVWIHLLMTWSFFIGVGGVLYSLLMLMFDFDETIAEWFLYWGVLPITLGYFFRTALHRGWVKQKNLTVFRRSTGMVEFTAGKERHVEPFGDFDGYLAQSTDGGGFTWYRLRLVNRKTGTVIPNIRAHGEPWKVELEWEELQQFMDVSRPLPDTPYWETLRCFDPTTRQHDERFGRPEQFWFEQEPKVVAGWSGQARVSARGYPWGRSREEALALGWKPSGVGDGEAIWRNWPRGEDGRRRPPADEPAIKESARMEVQEAG